MPINYLNVQKKTEGTKHVNVIDLSFLSFFSLLVLKIQFSFLILFMYIDDLVQFFFFWSVSKFFWKQTRRQHIGANYENKNDFATKHIFLFGQWFINHQDCLRVFPSFVLVFGFKKYAHFLSFAFIFFRTVRLCVCVCVCVSFTWNAQCYCLWFGPGKAGMGWVRLQQQRGCEEQKELPAVVCVPRRTIGDPGTSLAWCCCPAQRCAQHTVNTAAVARHADAWGFRGRLGWQCAAVLAVLAQSSYYWMELACHPCFWWWLYDMLCQSDVMRQLCMPSRHALRVTRPEYDNAFCNPLLDC